MSKGYNDNNHKKGKIFFAIFLIILIPVFIWCGAAADRMGIIDRYLGRHTTNSDDEECHSYVSNEFPYTDDCDEIVSAVLADVI